MGELVKGRATICVVNYKTLDLTRLCLRSIRRFTKYPYEVVVVDNNSQDESLEYLRSLDWIKLVERTGADGSRGSDAEGAALDAGLAECDSEFYIVMHSDTFAQRENWLGDLIDYFDDDNTACVGSGKLEFLPQWRMFLKKATDFKAFKRKILGKKDPHGQHRYHNRTICCLYRTDVLRREKLTFMMGKDKGLTSGHKLYLELLDRGYKTVELPPVKMMSSVLHLAHATQIINPEIYKLNERSKKKYGRIIEEYMSSGTVQDIMKDETLDRRKSKVES